MHSKSGAGLLGCDRPYYRADCTKLHCHRHACAENIDFQIEERYVRTAEQTDQVEVGLDGVEPIKNGAIDIGELAVQSLCLAATAWPRVDDAPDCYSVGEQEFDHPFAGLSALKRQNRE